MTISPISAGLVAVLGLLGIGLYGLLVAGDLIRVVLMLQLFVKATVLALALAGSVSGRIQLGQSLALTVIVADTIVAVLGLALAVQVRRRFGTLDLRALSKLRG